MLSPSELKKRQFSKALRGYSAIEVDEHLDFILEKYTELYRRNDELEKELSRLQTAYDQLKESEDAIRRAMVNAQREERKVIDEANSDSAHRPDEYLQDPFGFQESGAGGTGHSV